MVASIVVDLSAAALIIAAFLNGRRKGFVRMVWGVVAWIITAVISVSLVYPVTVAVSQTQPVLEFKENMAGQIKKNIYDKNSGMISTVDNMLDREKLSQQTGIPEILIPEMPAADYSVESAVSTVADRIVDRVTLSILRVVVGTLLFVVIRMLMSIIYHIITRVSKLPVINGVNKLSGGIMGVISFMFVVYLVLGVMSFMAIQGSQTDEIINNSYLVKYFYNNNILLHLMNL